MASEARRGFGGNSESGLVEGGGRCTRYLGCTRIKRREQEEIIIEI